MTKPVPTFLWIFLIASCCAQSIDQAVGQADNAYKNDPYFPKPGYFRKNFAPAPVHVDLAPPVQIEDYIVEGKLELSLKSYLSLVMANNADISIQRLVVQLSRNTLAGSFGMFDPNATASFSAVRSLSGTSNATSGATTLNQLSQPLNMGVTQLLPSGAFYNLNFSSTKFSSNSSFATLNPSFSSGLNFSVSQPLLRGRGAYLTKIPIMLARSRLRSADYNLEDQLTQFVTSAEMAYWDAVGARENVRVAEESLKLADTALKRAERELELGASSPLDIFQPQQSFANAQLVLAQTQFALTTAQDGLRRQMGADLDPKYRKLPLELTESIEPTLPPGVLDREQLVDQALTHRQDLKVARQALDADNLNIQQTNDALRPSLSLSAQYGSSGTGGNLYQRADVFGGGSQVVSVIPGGIGDALGQLFGFGLPTYGFGLTLQLPIRNRTATANLANATINKKLDALRVRTTEENVRLQVLNAVTNVENSKASVALAKTARDLSVKRVDADKKKYELGAEVIFFVLQAQNDLTTAESALVRENINLRRNQLTLLQRIGTLLEERGDRGTVKANPMLSTKSFEIAAHPVSLRLLRTSGAALLTLVLYGCGQHGIEPSVQADAPPSPIAAPTVAPTDVRHIRATGTVQAVHVSNIVVPSLRGPGGALTLIAMIHNGSMVKQGDILAEFDPTQQIDDARDARARVDDLGHQIEQNRAQARADSARRASDLRQAEADLAKAAIDLRKGETLSEIDRLKDEAKLADAKARVESLKKSAHFHDVADAAGVHVLELQRDRQQVALDRAQGNMEKLTIHAPLSGMVAHENVWRNGSTGPMQVGDQSYPGQPLIRIFDPVDMVVNTQVSEPDGAVMAPGTRAKVRLDAYPGAVFDAHLESASPAASSSIGSPLKTFSARFRIDQHDPRLLPDLSAAVEIEIAPVKAAPTATPKANPSAAPKKGKP